MRKHILVNLLAILIVLPVLATPFDERNNIDPDEKTTAQSPSANLALLSDNVLLEKAESAKTIDEFIDLAQACRDKLNSDKILLLGAKVAKSESDFHKLYENCFSNAAHEELINKATDFNIAPMFLASQPTDVTKKIPNQPTKETQALPSSNDTKLLKQAESAQTIDAFINLAKGCQDKLVSDKILLLGAKVAKSESDFHRLYEECFSNAAHEEMINKTTDFNIAPMFR
ncbi:MAG: hypothetical protein HQM08_28635 [Candidatus Riflebacteria bacterium]|nr:hypothetical protein [Candidatus Riflebacteria bacterium]